MKSAKKGETVDQSKRLNVAIVGGGPGCKAIMDMVFAERLTQLHMNLIGVADRNPDAVGYRYARERGIYTTNDYRDLYKLKDLNMIIELTGRVEVAGEISRTKPSEVRLMDHVAARLFWDVFQIEEQGIAERGRAEEALRESQEEKEAILNSLSEAVVYHDTVLRMVWANRIASEQIGLTPEQLVGHHCYEVFHHRSEPCPRCPVLRTLETGQVQAVEMISPDGRVWFVRSYAVRDADDAIAGVVEVTREITGRKTAEEALRKSEEMYSTLVESSLTGIYIDQGGEIVFANKRFAEIYGYSLDELLGMESRRLVHPEDRDLTDDIRSKRLKGEGAPMEYEARGLTKDGEVIWIARRNSRIEYQGKPAILGNIVEITERRQAEKALRESMERVQLAYDQSIMYATQLKEEMAERKEAEAALKESQERYYTVLEACPDPLVVYDMDGRGVYINPAFTRVFGWTPGELLGMKLHYVPDENWPETQMMIDKVLMGESFSGIESRRYTKEGKILDVSISAAIYLNDEGRAAGSIHILRDITEQKRVAEALRKAHDELELRVEERTAELAKTTDQLRQELAERKRIEEALQVAHEDLRLKATDLEAANEELSQYAYVVSHDLKAPLRAIRNYVDFLREDLQGTLDEDQETYLDGLKRSVRQGEELVRDLLEFSGVGTTSAPSESIDMGDFLKELIASLDLSPDVEVVMGNEWPTIEAEPGLMRQMFQNLISNAVKFNNAARKRVEFGWLPSGESGYELFVRDNGIGIRSRYHEQIFGVFQRLHTQEEYEGTGLGLAIVKKAAAKMHGSVRIQSEEGKGSTFFVTLPKSQRER